MEHFQKFTPSFLTRKHNNWGGISAFVAIASCFIASLFYWDQNGAFSNFLAANPELVFERKQYWRLLTSAFIHADLEHFLSNSLMLGFLTYFVAAFFGIWAPIFAFFMGALINLGVLYSYEANITLVGASGVVYFLWGFWLVLYVCIQKTLSVLHRLIRVAAIFLILLIPTTYSPQTSYLAHYLGFVLGVLAGATYYWLSPRRASKEEIERELDQQKEAATTQDWGDSDWEENLVHDMEDDKRWD